jgi:hypothetical protein
MESGVRLHSEQYLFVFVAQTGSAQAHKLALENQ